MQTSQMERLQNGFRFVIFVVVVGDYDNDCEKDNAIVTKFSWIEAFSNSL
jgi:hypothetical protein